MIILGVDLGDARTGIAASDPSETLASPVTVLSEWNPEKTLEKTAGYVKNLGAGAVVIGYPKNMNGTLGPRAEKCADFAKKLGELTGVETILWDERRTTVSAAVYMDATGRHGKKRKSVVDAAAAMIILQSYLDFRKNTKR